MEYRVLGEFRKLGWASAQQKIRNYPKRPHYRARWPLTYPLVLNPVRAQANVEDGHRKIVERLKRGQPVSKLVLGGGPR